MDNYAEFYDRITRKFANDRGRKALRLANQIFTGIFYAAYPILLLTVSVRRPDIFLKILLIPAVSFAIVTFVRAALDRPRPYEQEAIIPLIKKNTKGKSMPSRHVFSAAIIAMAYLDVVPWIGAVLLIFAALSAVIRVLAGVHYPKDVLCGYGIGVLCGMLFFLL